MSDLYCCTPPQASWVIKVRMSPTFLRIHFHKAKLIPYSVNQIIQTKRLDINEQICFDMIAYFKFISQLITTVWGSLASLSTCSRLIESILLYTSISRWENVIRQASHFTNRDMGCTSWSLCWREHSMDKLVRQVPPISTSMNSSVVICLIQHKPLSRRDMLYTHPP